MKKSRKKMLLSSIAMLLVALVALGSATFAWYFTNNTVTAETTQFSAAAASGLVIRHVNEASQASWTDKIEDLVGKVENPDASPATTGLTPASITYSGLSSLRGGTAQSGKFNESTIKAGTTPQYQDVPETKTNTNAYFLVDQFWVASSDNTTDDSVVFTAKCNSVADSTKYLNLAIYVGNDLKKVITWDDSNSGTVGKFVNGTTTKSVAIDAENATYGSGTGESVVKAAATVDVATISCGPKGGLNSGTCITIIGFADGFNSRCKSSSVDTNVGSVEFEFST